MSNFDLTGKKVVCSQSNLYLGKVRKAQVCLTAMCVIRKRLEALHKLQ